MPLAVREAHHFVFERRTVTRSDAANRPVVERRACDIRPHCRMRVVRRVQQPARRRVGQARASHERQGRGVLVSMFHVEHFSLDACVEVDRRLRQPRWRARLEPSHLEAKRSKLLAKVQRRRLAEAPCRSRHVPYMHEAVEERSGGHHHGARGQGPARDQLYSRDAPCMDDQPRHLAFDDLDALRFAQTSAHPRRIPLLVGLGARRPHSWAAAAIQHLELNAGSIDGQPHQAAKRIDFAHELTLRSAANRRITRHRGDRVCRQRAHDHAAPLARRRPRSLAARVSAADHDDIYFSY